MTFTINIPDNQVNRAITAFTKVYGYQDNIVDPNRPDTIVYIPNPKTKAEFCKDKILEYIKQTVINYELEEAKKAISISNVDVS